MRFGGCVFLVALGAILAFAVKGSPSGFDIQTAGLILLVIGGLGLALEVRTKQQVRGTVVTREVVEPGPPGTRETVYVSQEPVDPADH